MFGGGLPVTHLSRNRQRQKEWATVPTNFSERCMRRIRKFMNVRKIRGRTAVPGGKCTFMKIAM